MDFRVNIYYLQIITIILRVREIIGVVELKVSLIDAIPVIIIVLVLISMCLRYLLLPLDS